MKTIKYAKWLTILTAVFNIILPLDVFCGLYSNPIGIISGFGFMNVLSMQMYMISSMSVVMPEIGMFIAAIRVAYVIMSAALIFALIKIFARNEYRYFLAVSVIILIDLIFHTVMLFSDPAGYMLTSVGYCVKLLSFYVTGKAYRINNVKEKKYEPR